MYFQGVEAQALSTRGQAGVNLQGVEIQALSTRGQAGFNLKPPHLGEAPDAQPERRVVGEDYHLRLGVGVQVEST